MDMESELTAFCNQARLSVVELEHKPSHKTLDLQPVRPARSAGAMVAHSLWEGLAPDWSSLRPTSREGVHD